MGRSLRELLRCHNAPLYRPGSKEGLKVVCGTEFYLHPLFDVGVVGIARMHECMGIRWVTPGRRVGTTNWETRLAPRSGRLGRLGAGHGACLRIRGIDVRALCKCHCWRMRSGV